MDPEVWKMAATSFKIRNHQKGIFVPKLNHVRNISTERLVAKPNNVALSDDSVTIIEDKSMFTSEKANCANGFRSTEKNEMIKVCVRQRKTIYKHAVDKWADMASNSKDYRKSLALTSSGMEFQNVTKLPSEVENNRLPIMVSGGHTFTPQRQERRSELFRHDRPMNGSLVSTKNARTIIKKEPLFQGIEDAGLQHGIPFHHSNKRIIVKNNVPRHGDTFDLCKRVKIGDDSYIRSVEGTCQKMFNQHQPPQRQMPTVSGAVTYGKNTSPVTCKSATDGLQKDRCRRSPPDDIEGTATYKEKDKTEGGSTHRRFLLIDSQGLPYTVVMEEPRSVGSSNSTSTSWSDSPPSEVSKSLAPRKVYKCPVCFRIFEYLSYLQRHSIAHSQQKPHVCKVCGKAFKRTSHLTRHKYTHFGGKPCHCQICQRRFRDVGELARHQKSHTGEKNH
ncbi:uncharacterized protein RB166_011496 isoform 1-T2 [Leptodactylus fuscus]|uniref:uncharacterized protein LOC142208902 n=1 Tax=Leptodactylus fuscus TaxID=238119 RepID=UPI003F4E7DD7